VVEQQAADVELARGLPAEAAVNRPGASKAIDVTEPLLPVLPVAGPWITDLEVSYAADAAATAWFSEANKYHERFETGFAGYVDRRRAIALPSCTSAIHLSLLALGVGPGDEVIIPDITWIASSAPISYVGATPVFADIDASTWCLTVETVEKLITDRTRAVIAVDLYGSMPELVGLERLCADRGVALVEDSAEAVGASMAGRRAGSFGDTSVFSFHGSKTLTTGEGGMVLTDDDQLWQRMLFLRDHGREPGDTQFDNTEVAYKYKMSAMQAALGLAQLERVEELITRKRQIFSWYAERLADVDVTLNAEPDDTVNPYWMVTAIAPAHSQKELATDLAARGISTRPFFKPLSSLRAYAMADDGRRAREENVISYAISPHGINLPSALTLTEEDVERVCRELRNIL
jgi:perosamine synthetase